MHDRNPFHTQASEPLFKRKNDVLSHWVWAVPVLLVVALLTISKIDAFPPSGDEFYSLHGSGLLVDGPLSPLKILETVQTYYPDHVPGYYLILSAWGNLTIWEVGLARVLSILLALLSFAVAFRLARDFVAPAAGIMTLIVMAFTPFYGFHVPFVRMYTLLVLASGIVLWLYLRITYQQIRVKRTDYVLLAAAVFLLVMTHVFALLFVLMLGIYHLLIAPKNRRWLHVSVTGVLALVPAIPFYLRIASIVSMVSASRLAGSIDGLETLGAWFAVTLNGQPLLLVLSLAGIALGLRSEAISIKPWVLMPLIYLMLLVILAQVTTWIEAGNMKYHLAGWIPFALILVTGLYAWYSLRRWLFLLVIMWMIAGTEFHTSNRVWGYVTFLADTQTHPPTQVVSRLARRAPQTPVILGHSFSGFHNSVLVWSGKAWQRHYMNYSQQTHYFSRFGIAHHSTNDIQEFETHAGRSSNTSPSMWIYFQTSRASLEQKAAVAAIVANLNYEYCETLHIANNTVIEQYAWKLLDCQPAEVQSRHRNEILTYLFYGAELDFNLTSLYFVDKWSSSMSVPTGRYNMSYQLLSEDWENVAQLDIALVNPDVLRRYYIDVTEVAPGKYRLMAILYNNVTGDREAWFDNPGYVPALINLGEIEIH